MRTSVSEKDVLFLSWCFMEFYNLLSHITRISLLIEYDSQSICKVGGKDCEGRRGEGTIALTDS